MVIYSPISSQENSSSISTVATSENNIVATSKSATTKIYEKL